MAQVARVDSALHSFHRNKLSPDIMYIVLTTAVFANMFWLFMTYITGLSTAFFYFFSQIQSDSELDTSTDLNAEVFSSLPRSFKFNRSRFSDEFADGRAKRRESFGFPSTRLDESSNLLRMRANPSLGSSEPNLSGSCVSNNLS